MRKWIIGAAVLAVAVPLTFKLVEPVLVHGSGWAALPASIPVTSSYVQNAKWLQAANRARAALLAGREVLQAPALSVAVSHSGELVWRGVVGHADLEAVTPATFETQFRIGSTSKAVTAVAVGTLIDQGRLKLDAPIQTYVPAYPKQEWPVTISQVMSHRAGIRDYGLCLCFPVWEHLNRRHFETVAAEVGLVASSPLLFRPGTDFGYTSLGYNLVGAAVEGASSQRFGDYLESAVFKPLGMRRTMLDSTKPIMNPPPFYEVQGGQYKRAFAVDNSIRWPSGGILSTPSDMVKLGNAMLDDRLLTPQTRRLLITVPAGGGGSAGARMYALGWRHSAWSLHGGELKVDSYHHNGTAVGSTSVLVVLPQYDITVSVMMNKGTENIDGLAAVTDRILEAFIPS